MLSLWQSEFSQCRGFRWSAIRSDVLTCVRLNPTGVTLRATLLLGLLFVVVLWS